jgi:hypothetical protein
MAPPDKFRGDFFMLSLKRNEGNIKSYIARHRCITGGSASGGYIVHRKLAVPLCKSLCLCG